MELPIQYYILSGAMFGAHEPVVHDNYDDDNIHSSVPTVVNRILSKRYRKDVTQIDVGYFEPISCEIRGDTLNSHDEEIMRYIRDKNRH